MDDNVIHMHDDDGDALDCLLESFFPMICPRHLEEWDTHPRNKTPLPLLLVKTYGLDDNAVSASRWSFWMQASFR